MTKDEFLSLINDIDDKFLNELADGKRGNKRVKLPPEEYGAPQRPKVVRMERPPKKRAPRAPFIAAVTAAAVMVGAVSLVKNAVDIPAGESSGVVLLPTESPSFPIDISDYTVISEPASSEPALTVSDPTSYEPLDLEPVSSNPPFTDGKLKNLYEAKEGYFFALEIDARDKEKLYSQPILKTDSENEIAISFACSRECEGRDLAIAFYSYNEIYGTTQDRIATLHFTARSYTQWFTVPYKWNALKRGDKCVMTLIADDRDYTSHVVVKGSILP